MHPPNQQATTTVRQSPLFPPPRTGRPISPTLSPRVPADPRPPEHRQLSTEPVPIVHISPDHTQNILIVISSMVTKDPWPPPTPTFRPPSITTRPNSAYYPLGRRPCPIWNIWMKSAHTETRLTT